ncbi:MAG TPA: dicarboxylate/amino acid:cation symporter [Gemmatimonadaceae bacterium]|nr:dicarboxylate/amino acid:cation symporter [Gemmatimonadaceae bacterium]
MSQLVVQARASGSTLEPLSSCVPDPATILATHESELPPTAHPVPPSRIARLGRHLTVRVLVAIALGVLLGVLRPEWGKAMRPVGETFVNLVRMVIAPVIFLTIVLGIANTTDLKKVGRVGLKAFIYFEIVTTFALAIGLIVVNVTRPGAGIHAASVATGDVSRYAAQGKELSFVEFVTHIVPTSVVGAFASGDILQVVFFSILFGIALASLGRRGRIVTRVLERITEVFFRIVGIVMVVAPIGAFGAMAYTIGNFGLRSLATLGRLMLDVYLTMAIFIFVILNLIARAYGFSLWKLLKYIREEILIVLGTSSSESVLPRMIDKMERFGCARPVVGLVIPAGYSFNLDGTSIYLSMATIFIAQASGVELSIGKQLAVLGVLMVTSKGAAGVTGSGFIVLASTLAALRVVPLEGLALLLGVDRFMSEARSITNLIGNAVATVVIAKSETAFEPPSQEGS